MKKHGAYHLKLSVNDGKLSKKFYDSLFNKLGWETIYEDSEAAGYSDGDFTLWVVPAENKATAKHSFESVGFHHFSIRVPEKKTVDDIFQWCKDNDIKIADEPKEYPEYNEGYYAVFFHDPDGMKFEVTYLNG